MIASSPMGNNTVFSTLHTSPDKFPNSSKTFLMYNRFIGKFNNDTGVVGKGTNFTSIGTYRRREGGGYLPAPSEILPPHLSAIQMLIVVAGSGNL